jgi:outer membrane protein assembly factor BamB
MRSLTRFVSWLVTVSIFATPMLGYAAMNEQMPRLAPLTTVIGAFPAPPMGGGRGIVELLQLHNSRVKHTSFGKPGSPSGNSFYVAFDKAQNAIYIPTVAGRTYVVDKATKKTVNSFKTIKSGRVARLTPDENTLLVLSAKQLAAYNTHNGKQVFMLPVGGNAMALNPDGSSVYVGGNMDKQISEVQLPAGRIARTFPVAGSGDIAWADGKLFSANMKTGVMSVLNPNTGKITRIKTPEVDPLFNYHSIASAKAGFMQLAVAAHKHEVYAAGFSGHILKFSSTKDTYLGEVPVKVKPAVHDKLSGLAVLADGKLAVTTVENLKETVEVNMQSGKIIHVFPKVASNRWIIAL